MTYHLKGLTSGAGKLTHGARGNPHARHRNAAEAPGLQHPHLQAQALPPPETKIRQLLGWEASGRWGGGGWTLRPFCRLTPSTPMPSETRWLLNGQVSTIRGGGVSRNTSPLAFPQPQQQASQVRPASALPAEAPITHTRAFWRHS